MEKPAHRQQTTEKTGTQLELGIGRVHIERRNGSPILSARSYIDGKHKVWSTGERDEKKARHRRAVNPERLVSVIAVHDFNPRTFTRKPRPDVHVIVAVPEHVSFSEFERQWHQAVKREQRWFVYKRVDLQRVEHLARVIDYCANPKKSEAGNPIAPVHLPEPSRCELYAEIEWQTH